MQEMRYYWKFGKICAVVTSHDSMKSSHGKREIVNANFWGVEAGTNWQSVHFVLFYYDDWPSYVLLK